jgi:cytochrome P450
VSADGRPDAVQLGHERDQLYRDLIRSTPVCEVAGVWLVLGYDDVSRLLRDRRLSVEMDRAGSLDQGALNDPERYRPSRSMLNRDVPAHTRLRRLVGKAFTPRVVDRLRSEMQAGVDGVLDRAADAGRLNLIADLALPLPFAVISEMLGMPTDDRETLRTWSSLLARSLEPLHSEAEGRAIAEARVGMRAAIAEVVDQRRRAPQADLLSALAAVEEQGDVLSDEELVDQVLLLFVAGHETTVNLIGNGVVTLLRFPHELARLRADASGWSHAVEELLRFESPVQVTRRVALTDLEVGGRSIAAGAVVCLILAAANRDERRWGPDADELDVRRPDADQHVAFGWGTHHCLGAALARVEAQVALSTLVRRFPDLRLGGDPEPNGYVVLRGYREVPLLLGPPADSPA